MTPTDIVHVKGAHTRLHHTLAGLTDADARRPSLLPGWTVGHVLTHLARNADSHARMLAAAARGEVGDQYPGGNDQRAADIEAGASRPAAALAADVASSAAALEEALDGTAAGVWATSQGRVVGGLWPLAELPFRRWREVEVHHVDLGLGYGVGDWPEGYVDVELACAIAGLPARLGDGLALEIRATDSDERWLVPATETPARWRPVTAGRRVLLAWLLGRHDAAGFPFLGPWAG